MQLQIDIEFKQLLQIVKDLPSGKLKQLQLEIAKGVKADKQKSDLEKLLLNGPTATQKQLKIIDNNRKEINQWRTS